MTDSYNLPLVGNNPNLTNTAMMPATDAHMRRPVESDPRLSQLLPNTNHVEPPYTVAGLYSGLPSIPHRNENHPEDPSHAATALYTPTGTRDYQERIIACRVNLLDDDHPHSDDIDTYHDRKLNDEFDDDEREAYTDWIDSSFTQDEVNGFKRTVFTLRKPILSSHIRGQHTVSRPVIVRAFVVQTTPWGVIETGTYHWPDPDPGVARDTVTALADTLTHRVDRLPRPTPDDQWPLFSRHDLSKAELVTAMQTTIAELTDEQSDLKNEPGAVLTTLLDRFQADYDATQREALKILDVLEQRGDINDSGAGLITLT